MRKKKSETLVTEEVIKKENPMDTDLTCLTASIRLLTNAITVLRVQKNRCYNGMTDAKLADAVKTEDIQPQDIRKLYDACIDIYKNNKPKDPLSFKYLMTKGAVTARSVNGFEKAGLKSLKDAAKLTYNEFFSLAMTPRQKLECLQLMLRNNMVFSDKSKEDMEQAAELIQMLHFPGC